MPENNDDPQVPERLGRPAVPALDEILGQPIQVLDAGFVRVVDYMGGDASIVQAARVSYGTGTKQIHEDRGLIRYLLRHAHTTPFEMCELKLHVRVPMDCWRQWIRHRTANVNEYSTRYSVAIDACQKTPEDGWRLQSSLNRQGSSGTMDAVLGRELTADEDSFHAAARELYLKRLARGVAREQARKDLPLSSYTEAYWKIDLHNLFHFLRLRMDAHAQQEIRAYARAIGEEIVARWCPIAWEAFGDYSLAGLHLTGTERQILRALNEHGTEKALAIAKTAGWLTHGSDGKLRANRERSECETKLRDIGLLLPW